MSLSAPQLSIVIPSHQRCDLLQDCLASVVCHAPATTEIIVVDDGSSHASVSHVAHRFAQVRVVRLVRRAGFCVAANHGIRASRGEIVELLNDDTVVTEGWADAALAAFSSLNIGAVAPLVLQGMPDQTGPVRIDSAGDDYDVGGFAFKRGHRAPLTEQFLTACDVPGASASSAFYRRSALERVGHFPEEFGSYFEDVDLSQRLGRAGYRMVFEPKARVWHRCGASHRRNCRKLVEQQSLNEERVFWRNVCWGKWTKAIPRHGAVLLAKSVRRIREGNLIPFVMGRLRAAIEIPAILRHSGSQNVVKR